MQQTLNLSIIIITSYFLDQHAHLECYSHNVSTVVLFAFLQVSAVVFGNVLGILTITLYSIYEERLFLFRCSCLNGYFISVSGRQLYSHLCHCPFLLMNPSMWQPGFFTSPLTSIKKNSFSNRLPRVAFAPCIVRTTV